MRDGLYTGKPLNGYLLVGGIEPHIVDEGKRKAIRRLFLEVSRWSFRELLKIAEDEGLTASGGRRLGLSSLHNMLSNPFYAGMVRTREGLVRGKHESMVSPGEFEAAQNALAKRRC